MTLLLLFSYQSFQSRFVLMWPPASQQKGRLLVCCCVFCCLWISRYPCCFSMASFMVVERTHVIVFFLCCLFLLNVVLPFVRLIYVCLYMLCSSFCMLLWLLVWVLASFPYALYVSTCELCFTFRLVLYLGVSVASFRFTACFIGFLFYFVFYVLFFFVLLVQGLS